MIIQTKLGISLATLVGTYFGRCTYLSKLSFPIEQLKQDIAHSISIYQKVDLDVNGARICCDYIITSINGIFLVNDTELQGKLYQNSIQKLLINEQFKLLDFVNDPLDDSYEKEHCISELTGVNSLYINSIATFSDSCDLSCQDARYINRRKLTKYIKTYKILEPLTAYQLHNINGVIRKSLKPSNLSKVIFLNNPHITQEDCHVSTNA